MKIDTTDDLITIKGVLCCADHGFSSISLIIPGKKAVRYFLKTESAVYRCELPSLENCNWDRPLLF